MQSLPKLIFRSSAMTTNDTHQDFSAEFPLRPDIIYLNHAAVAPWPRRASEAVKRFAEENATLGAHRYPQWLRVETALREQLRTLLNAPDSDDIALLKNTSEGLSVVAHGLEWQAGDNIVISNEEFPSNRIVWESLRDRGVGIREADLHASGSPEDALISPYRCAHAAVGHQFGAICQRHSTGFAAARRFLPPIWHPVLHRRHSESGRPAYGRTGPPRRLRGCGRSQVAAGTRRRGGVLLP